jgi:hypothetical protein
MWHHEGMMDFFVLQSIIKHYFIFEKVTAAVGGGLPYL